MRGGGGTEHATAQQRQSTTTHGSPPAHIVSVHHSLHLHHHDSAAQRGHARPTAAAGGMHARPYTPSSHICMPLERARLGASSSYTAHKRGQRVPACSGMRANTCVGGQGHSRSMTHNAAAGICATSAAVRCTCSTCTARSTAAWTITDGDGAEARGCPRPEVTKRVDGPNKYPR